MEFTPESFVVEDLLDFSNDDGTFDSFTTAGHSDDSSPVAGAVDSSNSSSFSGVVATERQFSAANALGDFPYRSFSGDLSFPDDDVAELEWLSNFVGEESFSREDHQKLHLISGPSNCPSSGPTKTRPEPTSHRDADIDHQTTTINHYPLFSPESLSVPARARSKRSRAAPCSWTSRLQVLSQANQTTSLSKPKPEMSVCLNPLMGPGPRMTLGKKKAGAEDGAEGRRCLHCATTKTPQWRAGPMGPKTLCNACGVRYKSGRLVPEYRPASSPTFILTKHSNSHRKVMELRRQKELVMRQQMQGDDHHRQAAPLQFIHRGSVFDMSNPDEYSIHQHVGPVHNLD